MHLAIDIGNTRTKLALFNGDRLTRKEIWETLDPEALRRLAYNQKVSKVVLCSVATAPQEAVEFLKNNFYLLELTAETPLPFVIRYKTPHTLGKDRIAAAAGAHRLFPGKNCVVIDAGTCITYDVLSADEGFLGGNIAPGVEMRLKAMHHFTARLPLVQRTLPVAGLSNSLGDSTESALRNGGEWGAVWEMRGFISECRRQFGPLKVVITGGDADFFAKNLKTRIFARPNLVLEGLHQILNYNVKLSEASQK